MTIAEIEKNIMTPTHYVFVIQSRITDSISNVIKMILNACKILSHSTKALCNIILKEDVLLRTRQLSAMASKARQAEERKVKVNGVDINYIKVGTGDYPVLLLPGGLGTIWTDFKPQIEKLDTNKFIIVAWDPPGYGKSRPPDRMFPDDFLQRDAALAHDLMKTLGYKKFSLIGWSIGGITSLLLASIYPESIYKMVVMSAYAYTHPYQIKSYESIKNIDTWSEKMRSPMIQIYGEDYFRKTWFNLVDTMQKLCRKQNGDICKKVLPKIKCPTLIVHGARDTLVFAEHSKYLEQNIANSKLHIFEKGGHNVHLKYADEFNKLVTDFLVEQSEI